MQSNTFLGLIVGENIITLQRVSSTNDYLKNHLSKSTPYQEGTVIMAVDQFAGRGQAGNTWKSEAGKNLTCSVLLNPSFLSPRQQFQLNIAISLAIIACLENLISAPYAIKWPNDLYCGHKKLGGMLMENVLQGNRWKHAIIGIGLNINQTDFGDYAAKICSLKELTGKEIEIPLFLKKLCQSLSREYQLLKEPGGASRQKERYLAQLYRLGIPSDFLIQGTVTRGTIIDVTEEGRLLIDIAGALTSFGIKEVSFL